MGYDIKGIDVSKWQGEIEWNKVKEEGVDFAFIRAGSASSYGPYEDTRLLQNVRGAKDNGIPFGLYWYVKPGGGIGAQADMFVALNRMHDPQLPPVLDVEDSGKLTPEGLRAKVLTFAEVVLDELGDVMIYCAPGWWNYRVAPSYRFSDYKLWVAHWDTDNPTLPRDWKEKGKPWLFWQTHVGQDGPEYGMDSHGLDHNVFNGTREEFDDLVGNDGDDGGEPGECPECPECPDTPIVKSVQIKILLSNGDEETWELERA